MTHIHTCIQIYIPVYTSKSMYMYSCSARSRSDIGKTNQRKPKNLLRNPFRPKAFPKKETSTHRYGVCDASASESGNHRSSES